MAATTDDIRKWFSQGVGERRKFMVVMEDPDRRYYRIFSASLSGARALRDNPPEGHRYSESFNLKDDREEQLANRQHHAL